MVWFGMVWYGFVWLDMVWFGRGVCCNYTHYIMQCILRSRPPESEIEIELERTWEASEVDLEMVWT